MTGIPFKNSGDEVEIVELDMWPWVIPKQIRPLSEAWTKAVRQLFVEFEDSGKGSSFAVRR
jgi:hypothetical protein